MYLSQFYFTFIGIYFFYFPASQIEASRTMITAKTQILFKKILDKNTFFPGSKNVKFTVSINKMADLPLWLKLEQKESNLDAILFGTPPDPGLITLEVIAWNKENYETVRNEWIFSVEKADLNLTYQMEFKIKNKDLVDMFPLTDHFVNTVQIVWPNAKFISSLQKPTEGRGGFHPLPGNKEGIYVAISGDGVPPDQLTLILSNCETIPENIQQVFEKNGFQVDWCALNNISYSESLKTNTNAIYLLDNFETFVSDTQDYNKTSADITMDLVYVLIPFLIGILAIIILTFVMCSSSKYKMASKAWFEHEIFQKTHFNDISDKNITGFVYGELDEENTDSRSGTPHQMNEYNSLPKYQHFKANGNIKDSHL